MPSKDAALCKRLKATQRALDTMPRVHGGIVQLIDPIAEQIAADVRAALALIARLTAERDAARDALARLGSMEAFAVAGMAGPELIARVDYARAALAPAPAEGESDA